MISWTNVPDLSLAPPSWEQTQEYLTEMLNLEILRDQLIHLELQCPSRMLIPCIFHQRTQLQGMNTSRVSCKGIPDILWVERNVTLSCNFSPV